MKHRWFLTTILLIIGIALSGCGQSVEEQIDNGVASAHTVFEKDPQMPNKKIGEIELYVPSGYGVTQTEDKNNFILEKGKQQFILFVNVQEEEDSKLHYELLKKDKTKKIIKEETVELDGAFGFTAVIEHQEDQFELIVSSGGVKVSTISEDKKIDAKLLDMMQIARSVEIID